MTYSIEFELKGLPRMTNPSGRKSHWAIRAKEAKTWKDAVARIVTGHKPPRPLAKAELTLTRFSAVSPDADGLVVAGVLENDRFENIGMPIYKWARAPRGKGFVKVRVEERE